MSKNMFDLDNTDVVSSLDELPIWSAPFGLVLLEEIPLKKNAKVLDIGCGTGFPLVEVAQRIGSSSVVYGIDPWKEALERVRFKCNTYGINNIELINGKAEQLPFDDNTFDLIISNNGLNNVENFPLVLSECFRTLKPDSELVFTVNLPDTMIEFYTIYKKILDRHGFIKEIDILEQHIYQKRKPLDYLEKELLTAGFRNISARREKFFMRFVDGTAFFNHSFIKLAFYESWLKIINDKAESIMKEVEQELNLLSEELGELRLSIPFVCFKAFK